MIDALLDVYYKSHPEKKMNEEKNDENFKRSFKLIDEWGECIFDCSYSTEEEAIKDYQRMIDIGIQCPHKMLIIPEYSITYEH